VTRIAGKELSEMTSTLWVCDELILAFDTLQQSSSMKLPDRMDAVVSV